MLENSTLNFLGESLSIVNGETHRRIDDFGNMSAYYVAVGYCMGHTILFYYTNIDDYNTDYVNEIINGIPDFASNYLLNVMRNHNNLLVHLTRYPNADSCYDIYYDFDGVDLSISELVNWMQFNNDFAAITYRYTEIKNGKQSIPN